MSDQKEQYPDKKPPYFDESLIINTRLSEIERQQNEDKKEQQKYNRSQLRFNKLLTTFTGLLFVTSAISDVLMWRYVNITKQSADAATSAADTASHQLELTERPWVYADAQIAGPLTFDKRGAH